MTNVKLSYKMTLINQSEMSKVPKEYCEIVFSLSCRGIWPTNKRLSQDYYSRTFLYKEVVESFCAMQPSKNCNLFSLIGPILKC